VINAQMIITKWIGSIVFLLLGAQTIISLMNKLKLVPKNVKDKNIRIIRKKNA
jgi:hypothetical protein